MPEFDRKLLDRNAAEALRHRAFPAAVKRYAEVSLGTFDERRLESKIVCQTARYVTLFFILHLDDRSDGSGVTLARLQESVASGPFASPGWVKLAVRTFERTGMIEYLPGSADRRRRPFRPTGRLIELGREALAPLLRAVATVLPLPEPPAVMVRRRDVVHSFAATTVEVYFEHRFLNLEPFPDVSALLGRDFGHLIFSHMLATLEPQPDGSAMASAPASELALRFGVSRSQVRKLVDDATGMGLLEALESGGRRLRLMPGFADTCRRWVATDLAWMQYLATCAAERRCG